MYWQKEISGKMKEIVMKFFDKKILDPNELKTLKWYIAQWIDNTKLKTIELKNEIDDALINYVDSMCVFSNRVIRLNQNELYYFVSHDLLAYGIDPF